MKGKTLSALGLIALIAGVAIIIFYKSITSQGVVLTAGLLFMAVGLANLIVYGRPNRTASSIGKVFTQISNAAAIVLGICMLVFQSTFAPLVSFIFGLLIAVCALWQFFLLAVGTRPYQLHGWLYVFPLLLTAGAIFIFVQKVSSDEVIVLTTGIAMAVMGVGCFCQGVALGMARRQAEKPSEEPKHAEHRAEEAETATASTDDAHAETGEN